MEWPGGPRVYPSARRTIIALVNGTPEPTPRAYDPHWNFNRYFRLGRYQRSTFPEIDVLTLFKPEKTLAISSQKPTLRVEKSLVVHIPSIDLGIDLAKRGHEVRKLFFAGFARRVYSLNYDPEDVLQEIYKGILIRNRGKCPFDPRKSSFGHYVHMVAGCILSNYRRRYSRISRNEQYGVRGHDNTILDVAEADLVSVAPAQEDWCLFDSSASSLVAYVSEIGCREGHDRPLIERCVQFLAEGMKYREMSEAAGVPISKISEVVRMIKRTAIEWREASDA